MVARRRPPDKPEPLHQSSLTHPTMSTSIIADHPHHPAASVSCPLPVATPERRNHVSETLYSRRRSSAWAPPNTDGLLKDSGRQTTPDFQRKPSRARQGRFSSELEKPGAMDDAVQVYLRQLRRFPLVSRG